MENEIMEMENMEMDTDLMEVEATEIEACDDSSTGKIIAGVVAGAAAIAAGVAVYLHKTKDKREAKKIEKFRAKGYTIIEPSKVIHVDSVDVDSDECDVEEDK